jgi:hypothetical protein
MGREGRGKMEEGRRGGDMVDGVDRIDGERGRRK